MRLCVLGALALFLLLPGEDKYLSFCFTRVPPLEDRMGPCALRLASSRLSRSSGALSRSILLTYIHLPRSPKAPPHPRPSQ